MTRVRRHRRTHLFFGDGVRIYTARPRNLVMYDEVNDSAWIASQEPLNLHQWR